jgi:hypothetical protein
MVMITILAGVFTTTVVTLLAHIAMTLKRQEKIQSDIQHLTLTLQHTNTILCSVIDGASGNRYKSAVRTVPEARY